MDVVLLGVAMFLAVILSQVVVLLAARRLLIPRRRVTVAINDEGDSALRVDTGSTLLETLSQHDVLVPSACGGKGTCGVCKVRIREGGGPLLPTEAGLVSPAEARDAVRLSCQVKIRGDLAIEIPPEVFSVRRIRCRVRSNHNVATFIKELVLELPADEDLRFRAGGYVQIECPAHELSYRSIDIDRGFRDAWDHEELWRYRSVCRERVTRAYSMANYPDERGVIMLNVRVATPPPDLVHAPPGVMSSYLFGLRPGDEVTVSGPYGDFFARDTDAEMCFVGGGAGMAPMRSHIYDQFFRLETRRQVSFWYGARSLREAFYTAEFDDIARRHDNFSWTLALSHPAASDGWDGPTGFIHRVLYERHLESHPSPDEVEYYLCGPPLMIQAMREMLDELGVDAENVMYDDFG